jgi:hypothetical protein
LGDRKKGFKEKKERSYEKTYTTKFTYFPSAESFPRERKSDILNNLEELRKFGEELPADLLVSTTYL